MSRRPFSAARRAVTLAIGSGLLAAAVLTSLPAAAATAPPDGAWATECTGPDPVYCIESATITTTTGDVQELSAYDLTASAATSVDGWGTAVRWAVDGWAGQSPEVTGGEVSLTLRTGSFVPRVSIGAATTLTAQRADDGAGGWTITITGTPAQVAWTTDAELAPLCGAAISCGDRDSTADPDGTGFRFEGRTQDLDGNPADFVDALDGTTVATDAQAYIRPFFYDKVGTPYLGLGMFGNPQLDQNGSPVRNRVTAHLPAGWFTAIDTTAGDALATGFDAVGLADDRSASLTVAAEADGDGVLLTLPELSFGSAIGAVNLYSRPSRATTGQSYPDGPQQVRAMADVSGGARVGWLAPLDEHGSAVTAYRARAYSVATGARISSCTSAGISCILTGLMAGQSYEVRVAAVNGLGEGASVTAPIERPTRPGAPRTLTVTPGPGRLVAAWTAPLSTGGQPVIRYTVRAYLTATGGTPFTTCTSTTLTCTLTGLTTGARVYVSALATNMVGSGVESARTSGIGWTVPGAPRSPAATSGRSRVTVRWTAPATTGGTPVTGYGAELWTAASGGSVIARCSASASARSCVTPVLTVGRTYYATVTARNVVGVSPRPARVRVVVVR